MNESLAGNPVAVAEMDWQSLITLQPNPGKRYPAVACGFSDPINAPQIL